MKASMSRSRSEPASLIRTTPPSSASWWRILRIWERKLLLFDCIQSSKLRPSRLSVGVWSTPPRRATTGLSGPG